MDPSPSDGLLIDAALASDEERFGQIVARYEAPLYRAAMSRLGRRELAEDAVQETFFVRTAGWPRTIRGSAFALGSGPFVLKTNALVMASGKPSSWLSARKGNAGNVPWRRWIGIGRLISYWLVKRATACTNCSASCPSPKPDALRLRFFGGLTLSRNCRRHALQRARGKKSREDGYTSRGAALAARDEIASNRQPSKRRSRDQRADCPTSVEIRREESAFELRSGV